MIQVESINQASHASTRINCPAFFGQQAIEHQHASLITLAIFPLRSEKEYKFLCKTNLVRDEYIIKGH
jgi:hypothetical protein